MSWVTILEFTVTLCRRKVCTINFPRIHGETSVELFSFFVQKRAFLLLYFLFQRERKSLQDWLTLSALLILRIFNVPVTFFRFAFFFAQFPNASVRAYFFHSATIDVCAFSSSKLIRIGNIWTFNGDTRIIRKIFTSCKTSEEREARFALVSKSLLVQKSLEQKFVSSKPNLDIHQSATISASGKISKIPHYTRPLWLDAKKSTFFQTHNVPPSPWRSKNRSVKTVRR